MQLRRASRQRTLGASCCLCALAWTTSAAAQINQPDPAEAMQNMFERMSEQAGPMSAMFGKLTDEQQRQIESIPVSVAEESRFGRKVLESFSKQMRAENVKLTEAGPDIVYVQKLLSELGELMESADRYRRFKAVVLEKPIEDAYSIPGGTIIVTRGLLERAQSEAALVCVLAHELSHLEHGHQLLSLKQSKLAGKRMDFGDGMLWASLLARPNRPEYESQADEDATRWSMQLGYDPLELSHLLARWDKAQDETMPWQKFVPGFVKSYPDAGKRSQAVARLAANLAAQYPDANYVGSRNLATRTPKSIREFP